MDNCQTVSHFWSRACGFRGTYGRLSRHLVQMPMDKFPNLSKIELALCGGRSERS